MDQKGDDQVEPFVREVEAVCDRMFPGPDGMRRAAYLLLGVAVRRLMPSYGRSGAQEEIVDFVTRMMGRETS